MPDKMAHNHQGQDHGKAASPEESAVISDATGHSKHNMCSLSRIRVSIYENCVHPLLTSRHTPSYDARSVSTGLVVGFVIPVGGQLLFLGILRLLFSFNYVIAAGFTFVSNPLNMIPLYYGYYCLGSYLMGKTISLNFDCFEKIMHPVLDKSFFWDALRAFGELGSELLIPWTVAAVVLGVIFGIVGYVVTYGIQKKRCKKAAQRLGVQYEQYLARLRDGMSH
jgi:uncharacterized protein (DUF2062 family)